MREERVADEATLLGLLLLAVDRADERPTFGGEDGLRLLGVAELAAAVRVAAALDHGAGCVDRVEAVLGVGRQRPSERLELRDDLIAPLVGCILEHRALDVAVQLDVAVVRRG